MALKKIPTFRTKSRSVPTLFAIHSTTTLWEGITKSNFEQNEFRNPFKNFESLEIDPKQKAGESGEKVLEKVGRICRDHSKQVL